MSRPIAPPVSVAVLLGRRLRGLRKARKLTQEELGEAAQLSGKFVGEIERGAGNPSLEAMTRLAAALDLELDQLVRFEESSPRGPSLNATRGFVAAERVAEYLAGRSATDIDKALRILRAALDQDDKDDKDDDKNDAGDTD